MHSLKDEGYNLEQLRRISTSLYGKIAEIQGLKDVQSSVRPGFPELVVEFDRMRLSHFGMNAFDVASLIKNKIEGFVATKYKEKDKERKDYIKMLLIFHKISTALIHMIGWRT